MTTHSHSDQTQLFRDLHSFFLSNLQKLVGEASSSRDEGGHAASAGLKTRDGGSALLTLHCSESGEPDPDPGPIASPPAASMGKPDLVVSSSLPVQPVLHSLVLSSAVHIIQPAVLVSAQHREHSAEVRPAHALVSALFSTSELTDSKHSATYWF